MIDLHTHTTASDGRCTPEDLVARAAAAGVTVLAVTDHNTSDGCEAAQTACTATWIEFVPGIEITAIVNGVDVHVLGYFIDVQSAALQTFLADQRRRRLDRVRVMVDRLAAHGISLDVDAIVQPGIADPSRVVGRPWIARVLVAGCHVATMSEAFDLWLARGRPAFVSRSDAAPEEVFTRIRDAGGIASLAHPVFVEHDEWIPKFARAGLGSLEAYHTDHDARTTRHYLQMADRLGLAVSGGSDYHRDQSHGGGGLGSVSLPADAYARLKARR